MKLEEEEKDFTSSFSISKIEWNNFFWRLIIRCRDLLLLLCFFFYLFEERERINILLLQFISLNKKFSFFLEGYIFTIYLYKKILLFKSKRVFFFYSTQQEEEIKYMRVKSRLSLSFSLISIWERLYIYSCFKKEGFFSSNNTTRKKKWITLFMKI